MNPPLELMTVLKELYNISGFRVSVHDTEMNELAGYPAGNSRFCSFLQQYPKNHATCVETDNEAFEKSKQKNRSSSTAANRLVRSDCAPLRC